MYRDTEPNSRIVLTAADNEHDRALRQVANALFGPIAEQQKADAEKWTRLCNQAALNHERDEAAFTFRHKKEN